MTANFTVCASQVLSTQDLKVRPERDVTEIVGYFLSAAEAVVAHWVEYSEGLLPFVMVPGDERSGEFYIYDRKKRTFWLLSLVGQRLRRLLVGRHAPENQGLRKSRV